MTNLPVAGKFRITATYGQKGKYWKTYHKGIDFVNLNHKIYATCNGTVRVIAYDENGWGQYVSVGDTDGRRHIFCHLVKGSVKVKVGQRVDRLTIIGEMGESGNATGVHLHYEIHDKNDKDIDPSLYLGIPNVIGEYDSADVRRYSDGDEIASWAWSAVLTASELGLMLGDADGRFRPKSPVSRQELAVVIVRLYNLLR